VHIGLCLINTHKNQRYSNSPDINVSPRQNKALAASRRDVAGEYAKLFTTLCQGARPTKKWTSEAPLMNNSKYEVVVGRLDTVYCGNSCMRASMAFIEHTNAAEGDVKFFENGKIKRQSVGSNALAAEGALALVS
jgi:hypothetical protein